LINYDQQRFSTSVVRFLENSGAPVVPVPDEENLRLLYRAFSRLPYENVSKILASRDSERPGDVRTSFRTPEQVLEGWLESRLGGTCFSLTQCLYALLGHCGYSCYRVLGDMHHGANIHCAVVVRIGGGLYLCDAGYLLPEPLALPEEGKCSLQGQIYRYHLEAEPGAWSLFTESLSGDIRWRYRLHNRPVDDPAFAHWWERSFSAAMNHQLILSRSTGESHVYVHKDSLRQTTGTGKHNENIRGRIGRSVRELFGIDEALVERAWELSERARGKTPGEKR
jgi:arylamine N-acetyltransferase